MIDHSAGPAIGILIALEGKLWTTPSTPVSQLVDAIYPHSRVIYIVKPKTQSAFEGYSRLRVCEFAVSKPASRNLAVRALAFGYSQLKAAYKVARVGNRVNTWISFLGADVYPLAGLTAKLLGKKVLLLLGSTNTADVLNEHLGIPNRRILAALLKANFHLADQIILYSDFAEAWGLGSYKKKVVIAQRHFVNLKEFALKKHISQRRAVVGFIGRFYETKGIRNFVEAIPKTLFRRPDVDFVIIGSGPLEQEVRSSLGENAVNGKVRFVGWIPHSELPTYLNCLKLLVIPSYTEACPNVMFEAMACGTPVLATQVGCVPDVIKERETGFLLRENSPACIAEQIVKSIEDPNLQQVAINARNLIESKYTYERVLRVWGDIINDARS